MKHRSATTAWLPPLYSTINVSVWLKSKFFQTGINYFTLPCFHLHTWITGYVYFLLTSFYLHTFSKYTQAFTSALSTSKQCSHEKINKQTKKKNTDTIDKVPKAANFQAVTVSATHHLVCFAIISEVYRSTSVWLQWTQSYWEGKEEIQSWE